MEASAVHESAVTTTDPLVDTSIHSEAGSRNPIQEADTAIDGDVAGSARRGEDMLEDLLDGEMEEGNGACDVVGDVAVGDGGNSDVEGVVEGDAGNVEGDTCNVEGTAVSGECCTFDKDGDRTASTETKRNLLFGSINTSAQRPTNKDITMEICFDSSRDDTANLTTSNLTYKDDDDSVYDCGVNDSCKPTG